MREHFDTIKSLGIGYWMVRLPLYPITALMTTPLRLVRTLRNTLQLWNGREWHSMSGYTADFGINNLFYWTRTLDFHRFGRDGVSPYTGLGDVHLSRFFMYTLFSLYLFWMSPALVMVLGIAGWWLSHFFWMMTAVDPFWFATVMLLALVSTTFYVNAFVRQNYNALGWMFFPIGLYGVYTQNWIVSGIAWILVSLGSLTAVALAAVLCAALSIANFNLIPFLTIVPACLRLSVNLIPLVRHGTGVSLQDTSKWLGFVQSKVQYRRRIRKPHVLHLAYFLVLYTQFAVVLYALAGHMSILLLAGIAIFLLNSTVLRFSDVQSMYMLMFSLATAETIQHPNVLLLASYWLLVSPLPYATGFYTHKDVLDVVPALEPFSIKPFLEGMREFLSPVSKGQRVFMAFRDPKDDYDEIFDGYRTLLELPFYVAAEQSIHFMPDWIAVSQLNYPGAPQLWGRDPESVTRNLKTWKAQFVVVYQDAGTELDSQWKAHGFEPLTTFSWAHFEEQLRGDRPYLGVLPQWWLLKPIESKTWRP